MRFMPFMTVILLLFAGNPASAHIADEMKPVVNLLMTISPRYCEASGRAIPEYSCDFDSYMQDFQPELYRYAVARGWTADSGERFFYKLFVEYNSISPEEYALDLSHFCKPENFESLGMDPMALWPHWFLGNIAGALGPDCLREMMGIYTSFGPFETYYRDFQFTESMRVAFEYDHVQALLTIADFHDHYGPVFSRDSEVLFYLNIKAKGLLSIEDDSVDAEYAFRRYFGSLRRLLLRSTRGASLIGFTSMYLGQYGTADDLFFMHSLASDESISEHLRLTGLAGLRSCLRSITDLAGNVDEWPIPQENFWLESVGFPIIKGSATEFYYIEKLLPAIDDADQLRLTLEYLLESADSARLASDANAWLVAVNYNREIIREQGLADEFVEAANELGWRWGNEIPRDEPSFHGDDETQDERIWDLAIDVIEGLSD